MTRTRKGFTTVAVTLAGLAVTASSCGTAVRPGDDGNPATAPATVTVFAAASLKTAFTQLGTAFEARHPGVRVAFNFAGSQTLAEQLAHGAPADVFASAAEANLARVTNAGLNATASRSFATNRLTIAVPPRNPAGIATLSDLTRPGLRLVVCAPPVPCGAATAKVAERSGITFAPVSEEQAVSDVVAKVRAGEADAGLVYRTDVIAADGAVRGVEFPESRGAITQNTIVALGAGAQPAFGIAFVDLVLGPEGQAVLAAAGFGPAEEEDR